MGPAAPDEAAEHVGPDGRESLGKLAGSFLRDGLGRPGSAASKPYRDQDEGSYCHPYGSQREGGQPKDPHASPYGPGD